MMYVDVMVAKTHTAFELMIEEKLILTALH